MRNTWPTCLIIRGPAICVLLTGGGMFARKCFIKGGTPRPGFKSWLLTLALSDFGRDT